MNYESWLWDKARDHNRWVHLLCNLAQYKKREINRVRGTTKFEWKATFVDCEKWKNYFIIKKRLKVVTFLISGAGFSLSLLLHPRQWTWYRSKRKCSKIDSSNEISFSLKKSKRNDESFQLSTSLRAANQPTHGIITIILIKSIKFYDSISIISLGCDSLSSFFVGLYRSF